MKPSLPFSAALRCAGVLALALSTPRVAAQYAKNTALFNETFTEAVEDMVLALENAPDLVGKYFPEKYLLPRDYYELDPSDPANGYTQNVLFDPCRYHAFDCCSDTYGTKEFSRIAPATATSESFRYEVREDGSALLHDSSRSVEQDVYVNEACVGPLAPFPECTAQRMAARDSTLHPRCFNYNASVVADAQCRSPSDGTPLDLCLEVGITQTAHILECGGAYESDPHCGTFLEVHRPGFAEVLASTRLKSVFASGYRMSVITMTYKRQTDRTLCYDTRKGGLYEVWWVQRTLDRWRVERQVPFQVISPLCDWDAVNNRYLPYATVGQASKLVGYALFDPDRLLFSRERTEGASACVPRCWCC